MTKKEKNEVFSILSDFEALIEEFDSSPSEEAQKLAERISMMDQRIASISLMEA